MIKNFLQSSQLLPLLVTSCLSFGLVACTPEEVEQKNTSMSNSTNVLETSSSGDAHSYARPDEAKTTHLDLDIKVDFEQKVISGRASYELEVKPGTETLFLDARNLTIQKVTAGESDSEEALEFELGSDDPIKGQSLAISLTPETKRVNVFYQTGPGAAALQWLDPVQTAGKQEPFLFTQGQAILTRTWIPCQDGPGMRFTYQARVQVPQGLMAVMSATNPQAIDPDGIYEFTMDQPIPAYLMALSVGDVRYKAIGSRTGVYAEPATLDKAVNEFADMEKMLESAEQLYGQYRWDIYDVIVLPPSFPFGGMENPRLTFATPTILAGDRSLTSLIAHELAHSWSGNLVTNSNWDDFWLNEGFTVYFERRIMEALYGESYADMLAVLGYQDLQHTVADLGENSRDTQLKLNLNGRDPDDGMTDIAYEKGNFLLVHMESILGRPAMDAFLKKYFDTHAFSTMTTEGFIQYVESELIKGDEALRSQLNLRGWIYEPGIPDALVAPSSERFAAVDARLEEFGKGTAAGELAGTKDWSTHEWLHFIRHLSADLSEAQMIDLDQAFGFTNSGNSEILAAWFEHTIANNYEPAYPALESFLVRVGRRKFLKPLYTSLSKTPAGMERGRGIYKKARANYHAVSIGTIDDILNWEK